MATPNGSRKLEEKRNELDEKPVAFSQSIQTDEDSSCIHNCGFSNNIDRSVSADNGGSSTSNARSSDQGYATSDSAVVLKPVVKQGRKSAADVKPFDFKDGHDNEVKERKVKLLSCNQQPGRNNQFFLKMVVDPEEWSDLKVNSRGEPDDPHAVWTTHYTLEGKLPNLNQAIIFENEACTRMTGQKCVLYTQRINETDYILTGKKIKEIPERLADIDPAYGFYKRPKAIGSELLYLKSMLGSKFEPLLVGFDGAGEPLPLNKVKKYSRDYQAFFRII